MSILTALEELIEFKDLAKLLAGFKSRTWLMENQVLFLIQFNLHRLDEYRLNRNFKEPN